MPGRMIEGRWMSDANAAAHDAKGAFARPASVFRSWITPDGQGGFRAEPGRYHLYVSLACPWAHRTLIFRKLKGLEELIDVSVVHWLMGIILFTQVWRPPCSVNEIDGMHSRYGSETV